MKSPGDRWTLEVCVASADDAVAAEAGGADRLELNVALELGGLTPSLSLLQQVKQAVRIPVIAMVRPRGAGFCYSDGERRLMMRDAALLLEHGADGLAAGAMRPDGQLDSKFWEDFCRQADGHEIVFHRAFDLIECREQALEQLITSGTTRILTSGGQVSAVAGLEEIGRLHRLAGGRIEILPGAGITPENALQVLLASGCDQIHGTFRRSGQDPAGSVADPHYPATCRDRVARTRKALDQGQ